MSAEGEKKQYCLSYCFLFLKPPAMMLKKMLKMKEKMTVL